MERISEKEVFLKALLPAIAIVAMAFMMVVIAYGLDSVAYGIHGMHDTWVHDTFHDFRHVIGMPCH